MILNLLRYFILASILCNLPSFLLTYFGGTLGSLTSYASSIGLILFFILSRNKKILLPFVILGMSYFLICSLHLPAVVDEVYFFKENLRFLIFAFCSATVFYNSSEKEIYIILLIGALSIVLNAVVFPTMQPGNFVENYGRFSGFYLNPNLAGGACLLGYCLSFAIKSSWFKLTGQLFFTLGGILTFSRTFIVIYILISIISIYHTRKNLKVPLIGVILFLGIVTFSSKLTLNTDRFNALQNLFGGNSDGAQELNKDTRDKSWALYYDYIFEKPLFGNGYAEFQRQRPSLPGVHNSYLMVIGEAGIIPFLILIITLIQLLKLSFKNFKTKPWHFYSITVIMLLLMASHGIFNNFLMIALATYSFVKLKEIKNLETN